MTAKLLDGRKVSKTQQEKIKQILAISLHKGKRAPGLATILIGADPASHIYVNHKIKACNNVGIKSHQYELEAQITTDELLELIEILNNNNEIDGVLVQLPLPNHIDTTKVLEQISPSKDVDGFHPYNFGHLAQGKPLLRPCTPYGVIQLLKAYQIPLKGSHAVIVGASNIVGRPMASELLLEKATVTICHQDTKNLKSHIECADILIVAIGKYNVINPNWLKPHQVVIDVGIHRCDNSAVHGDIDFERAKEIVAWITPVPGGIGPMTICTLLENTVTAYNKAF